MNEKDYTVLTLKVKPNFTEIFGEDGRIIFVTQKELVQRAVLHSMQANNKDKFNKIRTKVWLDLFKSRGWKSPSPEPIEKICEYTTKKIDWQSEPITYRI